MAKYKANLSNTFIIWLKVFARLRNIIFFFLGDCIAALLLVGTALSAVPIADLVGVRFVSESTFIEATWPVVIVGTLLRLESVFIVFDIVCPPHALNGQ